jgi:BlaI family transcriptional regulator, penicillinase repressor
MPRAVKRLPDSQDPFGEVGRYGPRFGAFRGEFLLHCARQRVYHTREDELSLRLIAQGKIRIGVIMARRDRDVTEAELAILQFLWDEGPATVRRIIDGLYGAGEPSAHATVRKLLERLEAKGCISRDTSGPVQVISPKVGREDLVQQRIQSVADQLCGGSIASLLTSLIAARRIPAGERKALRDYLDRLDEAQGSGPEGKPR